MLSAEDAAFAGAGCTLPITGPDTGDVGNRSRKTVFRGSSRFFLTGSPVSVARISTPGKPFFKTRWPSPIPETTGVGSSSANAVLEGLPRLFLTRAAAPSDLAASPYSIDASRWSEDETSPTAPNSGVLSGSEMVELPPAPNSGISGTAELPSSSVRLRLTAAADLLAISAFLHSPTFRKNDASARTSGIEYSA